MHMQMDIFRHHVVFLEACAINIEFKTLCQIKNGFRNLIFKKDKPCITY